MTTILRTTSDDPQRAAAVSRKLEALAARSEVVELPAIDADDPLALYAVMRRDQKLLGALITGLVGFEGSRVGITMSIEQTCKRLIAASRLMREAA